MGSTPDGYQEKRVLRTSQHLPESGDLGSVSKSRPRQDTGKNEKEQGFKVAPDRRWSGTGRDEQGDQTQIVVKPRNWRQWPQANRLQVAAGTATVHPAGWQRGDCGGGGGHLPCLQEPSH